MAKDKKKLNGGTAAHADDVGVVHNLVNQGYKLKLQHQLGRAKESLEEYKKRKAKGGKKKLSDEELEEDPTFELDIKLLESAARWTGYNKVMPTDVETEDIKGTLGELEEIRRKQRGRICAPVAKQQ
jgi:hypothetical protein